MTFFLGFLLGVAATLSAIFLLFLYTVWDEARAVERDRLDPFGVHEGDTGFWARQAQDELPPVDPYLTHQGGRDEGHR